MTTSEENSRVSPSPENGTIGHSNPAFDPTEETIHDRSGKWETCEVTILNEKKQMSNGQVEPVVDSAVEVYGGAEKEAEAVGSQGDLKPNGEGEEEEEEEEKDPFAVLDEASAFKPWSESTTKEKVLRVIFYICAPLMVLGMLYLFICSLDLLTSAFKLLTGRAAGAAFTVNEILSNPVAGLMLGVLVTVLVQSSSTSTSVVVAMVASGVLEVKPAIPIIMGTNIGTTVTNLIVALTQSVHRDVFRRAFAGATVHDIFNWSTVILLLPLEATTNFLYYMTAFMTSGIRSDSGATDADFLKAITEPLTNKIVMVDSSIITAIAEESPKAKYPIIKSYCNLVTQDFMKVWPGGNNTLTGECIINEAEWAAIDIRPYAIDFRYNCSSENTTIFTWNDIVEANSSKCSHLFLDQGIPGAALSEIESGIILFVCSIVSLITCLLILVKVLNTALKGPMATVVRKVINADFPGYLSCLTGYFAMLVGAGITILVQSSSVTTAVLTPLVGMGLISVERIYPLVLGANIGTTVTGILAAMTADADKIDSTFQVALCHLFFNITGIVIWYPIRFIRQFPLYLAKQLGIITSQYRWFAVAYVIFFFLVLPLAVFGLSLAGVWVLVGVGVPLVLLVLLVVFINITQTRRPHWLPPFLRTWDFLPLCCHSFGPVDSCVTLVCANGFCRKCCSCFYQGELMEDVVVEETVEADEQDVKIKFGAGAEVPANGHIPQFHENAV